MKTSAAGVEFIKRQEGLRLHLYDDGYGFLTIGYGHLVGEDEEFGATITETEAEELLELDLQPGEQALDTHVAVSLAQHEFDALSSFVFNIGTTRFLTSTLLKLLNHGSFLAVPEELLKWRKSGGVISPGLVSRRKREGALFADGDYGS